MSATTQSASRPAPATGLLARPPLLGLAALGTILLWRPVAHSLTMLVHELFAGPARLAVSFALGIAGFVIMWQGFRQRETTASVLGILAGSLIWTGWAEQGFNSFAELLGVEPLKWQGFTLFTPGLLMIEASVVLMLMMLVMLGSNKDTQCRMFMWFHRTFHIWPGRKTAGYQRQIARVTTLEYLFVVWFFYVLNIAIFDPRLLGPTHPGAMLMLALVAAWGAYLIWQLTRIRSPGLALRYAIPCVGCVWLLIESAAAMRLFREIWLEPLEFPVVMGLWAVASAAVFAGYTLLPGPGGRGPAAAASD
jgi:hypothetical protein